MKNKFFQEDKVNLLFSKFKDSSSIEPPRGGEELGCGNKVGDDEGQRCSKRVLRSCLVGKKLLILVLYPRMR